MKFCSVFLAVLLVFSPIYTVFAKVNTSSVSETTLVSDTFATQKAVTVESPEISVVKTQTPNVIAKSISACDISTASGQSESLLQPQAFLNLNQPANCFNLGAVPLIESSAVISISPSVPTTNHVVVVRYLYFAESHALPEGSHVPFRIPTISTSQFSYSADMSANIFILLVVFAVACISKRRLFLYSQNFRELCVMRC